MKQLIKGIHHITAIASDPQQNLDFYTGVIGLKLVKKTVNFDVPDTYHFYYGDDTGSPGSILTFFPFLGNSAGRSGRGQLTRIAFAIPEDSISFWLERLVKYEVKFQAPQHRFGEVFIALEDPDGLQLALVATAKDSRPGFTYGNIPLGHAIKGIHSVTLSEDNYEKTADLLTGILEYKLVDQNDEVLRYAIPGNNLQFVDILCCPDAHQSEPGSGTVHHIAFSTPDDETQLALRRKIVADGHHVSPVMDREYFRSIYFREPGGVLFEVATIPPGFTVDEPQESLGQNLMLPPALEVHRAAVVNGLAPLRLNVKNYE